MFHNKKPVRVGAEVGSIRRQVRAMVGYVHAVFSPVGGAEALQKESVRIIIGECNCKLLDALLRWAQGGSGLQMVAL